MPWFGLDCEAAAFFLHGKSWLCTNFVFVFHSLYFSDAATVSVIYKFGKAIRQNETDSKGEEKNSEISKEFPIFGTLYNTIVALLGCGAMP